MSVASASIAAARLIGRSVDGLLLRPREVLGTLCALQIVATFALALSVDHNGWVYFQGGDQIWLATQGWLSGRLELAPTELGYLGSYALMPIMWITGPTWVQAVPALVLVQVLVLGPVALLCVYGIAIRIGGRLLGYWAALLWVVAPFASIPLFVDRYQERWAEQFLPQALGLTAMPDFPSTVLALAAVLFVVRSLTPGHLADAVFAGVLVGASAALKPSNFLIAFGAALGYAVARRWREGLASAAAAMPALLLLLAWKYRGLGELPVFALEQARVAAGASAPLADLQLDRYFDFDFEHWKEQMNELREFFWSARLAQWAPIAGLIAVLRVRRGAIAAVLGGWLAAFLVVKGFSPRASIQSNTFWRLLMPAWPAYLLLFASIPLLIPTVARRLGHRMKTPQAPAIARRWIVVATIASVALPAAALAASSPSDPPTSALFQGAPGGEGSDILAPVDESISLKVVPEGSGTRLTWTDDANWRGDVFYRVYRFDGAGEDTTCYLSGGVASYCYLTGTALETTREQTFLDASPPPGATYRIGVGTNWIDDPGEGDIFAFSPPVTAGG
ncbi:MAG TPA: hypothetical protein VFO56_07855 [Gaiellaceae bacterium]|nr:hypothetical protein [Gaiellaceae bacterium]